MQLVVYALLMANLVKVASLGPTLIVDATNDMRVAREEIFGPVAVVIKFHSEEEVIEQANDSLYGLGGGVFTQNPQPCYPRSSSNRNRTYVGKYI